MPHYIERTRIALSQSVYELMDIILSKYAAFENQPE
jgi:hypothetical protein